MKIGQNFGGNQKNAQNSWKNKPEILSNTSKTSFRYTIKIIHMRLIKKLD